jgi:hypothetical protein
MLVLLSVIARIVFLTTILPTFPSVFLPEVTPEPSPLSSLFSNDPCTPPCWFGIIPGQSNTEDVEQMLSTYDNIFIFNPRQRVDNSGIERAQITNGHYSFYWRDFIREDRIVINETISIEQGIVSVITVSAPERIALGEVLVALGQPEVVQMVVGQINTVRLFYFDEQVVVKLNTEFLASCNLQSLQQDFFVDIVFYYSPLEMDEVINSFRESQFSPTSRYTLQPYYLVPLQVWNLWLNGEVEGSCGEATSMLSEPIAPSLFTPTPTPTVNSR